MRIISKTFATVILMMVWPFAVSAAPSVSFVAGTPAGWDFHELDTDIVKNNTIDWGDLSIIAQQWLASGCEAANQWCGQADIDGSTGVDLVDYALLSKDWSKQSAKDVLLQTIYGTAQDSAGNIIYPNATHALSQGKECAIVFAVPQAVTLDKGWFKVTGFKANYKFRVRLFNVTGRGLLNTGRTIAKSDLDVWTPLFDVTVPTGSSVPSHPEGTQAVTDVIVNFDSLQVSAGEYLVAFNNFDGGFTIGSIVRGVGATVADSMGKYPDGTPLPKRATVTTSAGLGNTYFYYLYATSSTSYTGASNLLAFQITLANRPPVVNAGSDQTIIYPDDTVNLTGTAIDDDLPEPPGRLTTTWSKISGPGIVTFGNENTLNTTASFSDPGTYVLRLTANDGALSVYDDLTVTYRRNQPPTVDAGADRTVGILDVITLYGTTTDDGLPDPPGMITVQWTQQSGPGTAIFGDAGAATTTVTFTATGVYVLRLTASDGEFSNYDEATLTVLEGSVNNAPYVNAGPDQTIVAPVNTATLNATVIDDDLPNPPGQVTVTWSKQSGPGTVTFGNIHSVVTTATFSEYGTYVLRLTANDGSLTGYDETSITYSWSNEAPVPELYPTIHCIGIRFSYPGNPQHTVEYRQAGSPSWKVGHHLTAITNGRLAGSLFWLEPNTAYEVKITIGSQSYTGTVTTRADSPAESVGQTYYVATDGNDINPGTSASPFATVSKAASLVQPGDTVIVRSGTYNELINFTRSGTLTNPIHFKSETPLGAVIDGNGFGTTAIVKFTNVDNIVFEGFTVQNTKYAVKIYNSSNNWITGNDISCTDGHAIEILKNTSTNNVIQYNHIWDTTPGGSSSGGNTGVNMEAGRGSIIRYNIVHGLSNGIGSGHLMDANLDGDESINPDIDVYGNIVYDIGDDALEPEGTCINNRLWNNHIYDSFVAISLAPIGVGPAYVFRNTIFECAPIKFHLTMGCRPTYVYHNTSFKGSRSGYGLKTHNLGSSRNVVFRNNIFHASDSYVLYGPGGNLDYNLWFYTGSSYLVQWGTEYYSTLEEFQTAVGEELHGLTGDPLFVDAWGQDFRIQVGSPAIDAGVYIPGINDNYDGAAPDIGAFELVAN